MVGMFFGERPLILSICVDNIFTIMLSRHLLIKFGDDVT